MLGRNRYISGLIALFLVSLFSWSVQASQLDDMKTKYDEQLRAYNTLARTKKKAALEDYRTALEAVADHYQREGSLDALLAVRNELARFSKEQKVLDSIPEGAPSMIGAALSYYDREVAEVEFERLEKSNSLTRGYHKALDHLMKQLTRENKIPEALKVREELKKLDNEVKHLPALMVTKEFPCSACNGTGKTDAAKCSLCNGTGKCPSCDGRGKRPNIINKDQLVMCIHCQGTGKCKKCGGAGKQSGKCPVCHGKGKVYRRVKEGGEGSGCEPDTGNVEVVDDVGEAVEGESLTVEEAKTGDLGREIRQYVESLDKLKELNARNTFSREEFSEVVAAQEQYKGKLIESSVELVWAFPRGIEVRADAKSKGVTLIPVSLSVGRRAESFYNSLGNGAKISIRYGVVNQRNLTLFGIQRAR